MKGIKIKGIGAYTPPLIVTNDDLSKLVDTNNEWIKTRTGISERRITEGEDTSELAIKAVKKALDRSQLKGEDIDLIIVATVTPDNYTPSVSCLVQKEIGAKRAIAFDINAACTGFVFALNIASTMMKNSSEIKNALVIGSETLSKIVNWEDRSTCVLFGDGAGAVVVEACEGNAYMGITHSDGNKSDALTCKSKYFTIEGDDENGLMKMDGREVFNFAVRKVPEVIKETLDRNNLAIDEIDYFVLHQANKRIVDSVAKRLGQGIEKFPMNMMEYGNTSSASIPILLDEINQKGMLKQGMKIVIAGFGAGLSWGATVIEWMV